MAKLVIHEFSEQLLFTIQREKYISKVEFLSEELFKKYRYEGFDVEEFIDINGAECITVWYVKGRTPVNSLFEITTEEIDAAASPPPLNEGFINETQLEFQDISNEKKRKYFFPNGQTLSIGKPLYLNVSPSGGHRLYTEDRWCWYVEPKEGWAIKWRVKEGYPSFAK